MSLTSDSIKAVFIQMFEKSMSFEDGIRLVSKIIYQSPDKEINLDLRDFDLEMLGSALRILYLDEEKTLRIKAKNIGPFLGYGCKGTLIVEDADNIGEGIFNRSSGRLIIKRFKSLNLKNFANDSRGTIIINNITFNYFDDESFNDFSLEIYPDIDRGASNNIPFQFIPLFLNYNFSLDELRSVYLKLFNDAKHFMQRLGLKTNVKTPSFYISHIEKAVIGGVYKDTAGDYNNSMHRIRLFGGDYPDKTIFHELIHSILFSIFSESKAQRIYSEDFKIIIPVNNLLTVERNSKYVVEGITDFLTKYYYTNYDKMRKYDLNIVGFGYPEELEFIGDLLLDFIINKKMSFEDAIKIILNLKIDLDSITSKLLLVKEEFRSIVLEPIIKDLDCREIIETINKLDPLNNYDTNILSLISITILNLEKCDELYLRELIFPIELKKGILNTKLYSDTAFKLNGGNINVLNNLPENIRLDLSKVNSGFINLINGGLLSNLKKGHINSKSIIRLSGNASIVVAEKIDSINDNIGLVNTSRLNTISNNTGVIVAEEYSGSEIRYSGPGSNELIDLNNRILNINNSITRALMKTSETNYLEMSRQINRLNKEQEQLIEKEMETIRNYNISGIVTKPVTNNVDDVTEALKKM